MASPRVLIPHVYSRNVGDIAMLQCLMKAVREIDPGSDITVLASDPGFLAGRLDGEAEILGWPWPTGVGRPSPTDYARFASIWCSSVLSAIAYRLSGTRALHGKGPPLARFFDCDIVLSPGGDFISPDFFMLSTFTEMLIARIAGKRLAVCAQTIGPLEGFNRHIARLVLPMADAIIVRERESERQLRSIGIRDIIVTADLAFMLEPPAPRRRNGTVVIFPKAIPSESYRAMIRTLARRITAETEHRVVLMGSDQSDIGVISGMGSELGGKAVVRTAILSPTEMAEALGEAELIISSRMHAIILGSLTHTPFFALADSFKFAAVLDDLCPGCVRSYGSEGCIDAALAALGRREEVGRSIAKSMQSVRERSRENVEILRKKFKEWGYGGMG